MRALVAHTHPLFPACVTSWRAARAAGKGLFLTMTCRDKNANRDDSYSTPVSWAEFSVIRVLAEYVIPRALGFDTAFTAPDAHT